jgi:hypothetical protein
MTDDEPVERDYVAELRELIDNELESSEVDIAIVAREIVEKLAVNDPDLLEGWMHIVAESSLRDWIRSLLASKRSRATHQRPRTAFAQAAKRLEAGESVEDTVKPWLQTKFVGASGNQKNLGDMDHDDLGAARETYDKHARSNALRAALFAALEKKVKTGTVSDHYDNEKITKLWISLTDA